MVFKEKLSLNRINNIHTRFEFVNRKITKSLFLAKVREFYISLFIVC
jgi:hypothetical protein